MMVRFPTREFEREIGKIAFPVLIFSGGIPVEINTQKEGYLFSFNGKPVVELDFGQLWDTATEREDV